MKSFDTLSDDDKAILRKTTAQERRQIKERTRQLMDLAGGVEFLAPSTGVKKAQLSKYGSASEPDSFINATAIVELDRTLDAPMMVGALAEMLGYRLVPLEAQPVAMIGLDDITSLISAHSGLVSTLVAALADGVLDAHERRELSALIVAKITELKQLQKKVAE